jgi:hypothetical protein
VIGRANPNAKREGDLGAGWFNETFFYDQNDVKEVPHPFVGYWEDGDDPIQLLVDLVSTSLRFRKGPSWPRLTALSTENEGE